MVAEYSDSLVAIRLVELSAPTAVAAAVHGQDGVNNMDSPRGVRAFVAGGQTFAIVTASYSDAASVFKVSPTSLVFISEAKNDLNGFDALDGAYGIDIFEVGGSVHAIVGGFDGDEVQLIDLSDPSNPVAVGSAHDGQDECTALDGAVYPTTFTVGASTYAAVPGSDDNGVQFLQLASP